MFNRLSRLTRVVPPLFATIVALSTAGFSTQAAAQNPPLVHAIPNDINSLDPADIQGQQDQEIGVNIYERLVEFQFYEQPDGSFIADPTGIVPQLADSWTVDGGTVTFKLHPGVTFYPTGNPLTSEDVRWSFERLVSINGNGKNQARVAGLFTPGQVVAVDPLTVAITFMDAPNGTPMLLPVSLMSMKFQQFAIIDSVEARKHVTPEDPWANTWLKSNVASTGQYYVASRIPNQQLDLRAVPNHWSGEQPAFEHVVLRVTGDADLVALIRGGVVNYAAEGLTGRQYDALEAAGFPVLHGNTPSMLRLSFAQDKPPFTDALVREAMLYAIPYDRIISVALGGRGDRAICQYNPEDITCNNSYEQFQTDLDKARALLAEAGQTSFSFDFWYSTALPYNNDIAILIADSMRQIGVTMNLRPTPRLQLTTMSRARTDGEDESMSGMMLSEGVIWLNDPVTSTNSLVSKTPETRGNWSRFYDPEIDALHFEYRNSGDVEARRVAYQRIQDILTDHLGNGIPLAVLGRTIVLSPTITGATFSQDPYARYEYLRPRT